MTFFRISKTFDKKMLNFINILTVAYNSWCFESAYTLYYIYKAEGMAEGTNCACCGKGVLLECKRITFGRQKDSFCMVKGVHLKCKRGPFGKC